MKLLLTTLAAISVAAPAQAFQINAWERAMIGNKCADNVETLVNNMAEVYDREAELRPITPGMYPLKEATKPGMRARVAMETNCAPEFNRRFWSKLGEKTRSDEWAFQMIIWYQSQPQIQQLMGEQGDLWWQ